ncbi:MAG: hypothetical protein KQ78_00037 [Candidatus Izimaplasma bacterium HR2]|nr:MAG: hypothetical protein KQ78_00037 [Candidatus Izimaplasma bacterium HR2]
MTENWLYQQALEQREDECDWMDEVYGSVYEIITGCEEEDC